MEAKRKALELRQQGMSYRNIAAELGVGKSTVERWLQQKSWLSPRWITISGGEQGPVDAFGAIPEPETEQLLELYEDTVYACTDWLSNSVSSVPLKVYVTTAKGQAQPKCLTTAVRRKSLAVETHTHLQLRHVIEHPLCDLLEHPNPEMTRKDLLKFVDMQLSLAGNCYVHIHRDDSDLPVALWPLMTQFVKLAADEHSSQIVGYWYQVQSSPVFYPKEDVIHFKLSNPKNPYGVGYSPTRGVYERILIAKNEAAYIASLFRNQARPDSIVNVKGATPDQIERMQKEWNMRNKRGGIGGVMFVDSEDLDAKPLSWAPKDLFGVDLYKYTKLQILNAFGLSPALFDSETSNRATADTARYLAQINAIVPRLSLIEEKLNCRLASDFDERLLVAFDSPVQEDEAFDLQKRVQYLDRKVYTINDVRKLEGLPPVKEQEEKPAPGAAEPAEENQAEAVAGNDLRQTVGGLQAIAGLQASFYGGQIPQSAAVANVMLLFGFSKQEAESLFPEIAPQKLAEDSTAPNRRVGFRGPTGDVGGATAALGGKSVLRCGGEGSGIPGPCPEGGAEKPGAADKQPGRPPAAGNAAHYRKQLVDVFSSKMKHLPADKQKEYKANLQGVAEQMSDKALERIRKHTKLVAFYEDTDKLTKGLGETNPNIAKLHQEKGWQAGGAYDRKNGKLHFNGDVHIDKQTYPPASGYSHELTHAIDGPSHEISDSPEWQRAWEREIKKYHGLTDYAASKASEGFAEFGRFVMTEGYSKEEIHSKFPQCAAVWAKHGLFKE